MARLFLMSAVVLLIAHIPWSSASGHWIYLNDGKIVEAETCWENGPQVKCQRQSTLFNINKSDLKKIVIDMGTAKERTIVVDRQGRLTVHQDRENRDPYVEDAYRRLTLNEKDREKEPSPAAQQAYKAWKTKNDRYEGCRKSCADDYTGCRRSYNNKPTNPRRGSLYQCSDTYKLCTDQCEAVK